MSSYSNENRFNICVFPHIDNFKTLEGGKWRNWGLKKKSESPEIRYIIFDQRFESWF